MNVARRILPAAVVGLLLTPAAAGAGTYRVHACASAGALWDNTSWALEGALPGGISADRFCPKAGQNIDLSVGSGAQSPDNSQAILSFRAPTPNTIEDFRLDRRLVYTPADVEKTHRYFATYVLGSTVFAGAGNYDDKVRDALHAQGLWYGHPQNAADTKRATVSVASFKSLAGYRADAASLSIRVGCFKRGSPCALGAGGKVAHEIFGAEMVVRDVVAPSVTVEATGLLAGGQRSGSDPVIVSAVDASGTRRIELIDVTDAAAPKLVGFDEYDPARPGATVARNQTACSFDRPTPCPLAVDEQVVASALDTGRRSVLVRVFDAAGNTADAGPFAVDVVTPSDRGPLNGAGAGETGKVTAAFARGRTRTTASYGRKVAISGQVLNAAGAPVGFAELRVLTRDLNREAFVDRGTIRTDAQGRFTYRGSATASRLVQFGWRSHVRDARFAASAYVTLRARASATLQASRRSVRLGQRLVLSGRLFGFPPARSVPLVAQGRVAGGRYRTFRLSGTRGRSGRFRIAYRFVNPASRGQTITLRVRILPRGGYPYESGASRTVRVRVR